MLVTRETKLHAAASAGQLEKVKELCRTEPHLINEGDEVDGVRKYCFVLSVARLMDGHISKHFAQMQLSKRRKYKFLGGLVQDICSPTGNVLQYMRSNNLVIVGNRV